MISSGCNDHRNSVDANDVGAVFFFFVMERSVALCNKSLGPVYLFLILRTRFFFPSIGDLEGTWMRVVGTCAEGVFNRAVG